MYSVYCMDTLDNGLMHTPGRIQQITQDFIILLKMVYNLNIINYLFCILHLIFWIIYNWNPQNQNHEQKGFLFSLVGWLVIISTGAY